MKFHRLDHVALRVADLDEASQRWQVQFGLFERRRDGNRAFLACDFEPHCLELIAEGSPGHDHTGFELAPECPLEQAAAEFEAKGVDFDEAEGSLWVADPEGNRIQVLPYREPEVRWVPHARPTTTLRPGHPRKLGHMNFLTARIQEGAAFYTEVLGFGLADWLGDAGVWFYVNSDHHVMALVDVGYSHLHHLAFDVIDIGQMRLMLDNLAQHGRWAGWGPTRHGVGGNIATYMRIVEEECFVELYCDMEQLQADHVARVWPDDRFSSNTWGPLPPRSYFRFDQAAIDSEQRSLETKGVMLAPAEEPAQAPA